LTTRSVEAGCRASFSGERLGLCNSSPPQLGQRLCNTSAVQVRQNVHSNEQMNASPELPGRSLPQHSQLGWSCNM